MRSCVTHSLVAVVLPLLLSSLSGCIGHIGDPDEDGSSTEAADPGRVTLHRLNRAEYDNTVRDLLGTKLTPAVNFPADDSAYGFDNLADTLSLSPVQFELYELTAQTLVNEAMNNVVPAITTRYEAEDLGSTVGGSAGNAWNLYTKGAIVVAGKLVTPGDYKVRVRAWQTPAPPDAAHMSIVVGTQTFGFDIAGDKSAPVVVQQIVTVPAGVTDLSVTFDNDFYDEATMADRNLLVDYIEIEGPLGVTKDNPLRDRIVTCDFAKGGDACLREILQAFAERAFRRPLVKAEVDGLMKLVALARAQGDTDEAGLRIAMRAILLHPAFLYRVELDEVPTSETSHPLSDYELASRLSYFLWSSMPDQALFDAASAGKLHDDAELDAQVDRMLADPKSRAMIDNFAGQWLYTRELREHQADFQLFPTYDTDLAASMKAETELFFEELLKSETLGIESLVKADFTYLDDRLAQHYGLPAPGSATPVRVKLDSNKRGGVLTQGSWLTVTSNPARTSPVKRGKWILGNLLCSKPPDPPPNIPPITTGDLEGKSVREVLSEHTKNPACASCHKVMDQLGFALENYDAIGAWRTVDNGFPIDASGTLPDGTTFQDETGMADVIAKDPRFPKCVATKMYTYAIGRGPSTADSPWLDALTTGFQSQGSRLRELIKLIVKSEPFRTRRGEKGGSQ
ncbi:Hypothetical protein A7982_02180 [Minicystis rosea]|nr:Hypothetical protein A7982_02180 [Minicystis rosea]